MIAPVSDASLPDVAQAAILFAIQTAAQQFQKSPTNESIAKPGSGLRPLSTRRAEITAGDPLRSREHAIHSRIHLRNGF
jgi:hypothetical protein